MTNELIQKFCRNCYTTTTHKIILVTNKYTDTKEKKPICLKCLKLRKEQITPIKAYEKELKIR